MKKEYKAPLAEVVKLHNLSLMAAVSGSIDGETDTQYSLDIDIEEDAE